MKRFKNIAVLLGETREDTRILARAQSLAKANSAELSVYATLDQSSFETEPDSDVIAPGEVVRHAEAEKKARLREATEPLRKAGIEGGMQLLTGKAFIPTVQAVMKHGHDLLMVPAEEGRSTPGLFLGGTPMHLLRKCPCPVWVFRPQRKRKFHRILAAVNLATQSAEETALNNQVMELATSLAEQENTELHVVFCWNVFGEVMLVSRAGFSPKEREAYVREAESTYQIRLDNFLLGFPIDKERTHKHLLRGDAGTLIPELVVKKRIELLVMGTVARSGIPGFFMGNIAEKILNQVPSSVLAVKPPGFESPVDPDRD